MPTSGKPLMLRTLDGLSIQLCQDLSSVLVLTSSFAQVLLGRAW